MRKYIGTHRKHKPCIEAKQSSEIRLLVANAVETAEGSPSKLRGTQFDYENYTRMSLPNSRKFFQKRSKNNFEGNVGDASKFERVQDPQFGKLDQNLGSLFWPKMLREAIH